jgi:hypothetical protein
MASQPRDKVSFTGAPGIVRKWRRVMAIGCSHGDCANQQIQQQVLDFKKRFQPEIRFELGDVMDTAAFRSGARGTSDEGKEVASDELAAVRWLQRYEPTHLSWGNHDVRLLEWMDSPNAVVAHAAGCVWNELQTAVRKLHCKTVPYDYEHGWFEMGGTFFGHGYWYNENSLRDHAEFLGGPTVMAHLHRAQMLNGRTRKYSQSFCVGTLADIDSLKYARRRRATSTWSHGVVFGEIASDRAQLWLASCAKGEQLRFPV